MALIPENRMEQILNGDNVTPDNRTEYFVKKAIDNAGQGGGGGSDLPTPGTAGNVLTSTGDAWESAAPSGGALRCTFTIGESVTCDKSIAEIVDALSSGVDVYGDSEGSILIPSGYDSTHALLQLFARDGADILVYEINGRVTDGGDVWSFVDNTVNGLPRVSASNNGQVLGVDDGAYALVSPSVLSPLKYVHFTQTQDNDHTTTATTETAADILDMLPGNVLAGSLYYTSEGVVDFNMILVEAVHGSDAGGYTMVVSFFDPDTAARVYLTLTAATRNDPFTYTD